jgi:hypothetical protein
VPQLVRGVADNPVGIGGGVALGELEILAPGGVAEVAAPVTVDQTGVKSTLAALTPWCSPLDQTASSTDAMLSRMNGFSSTRRSPWMFHRVRSRSSLVTLRRYRARPADQSAARDLRHAAARQAARPCARTSRSEPATTLVRPPESGRRGSYRNALPNPPIHDQGGACGAAGPAPAPGSALGRPARRKPGHPHGHVDQGGSHGSVPRAARSRLARPPLSSSRPRLAAPLEASACFPLVASPAATGSPTSATPGSISRPPGRSRRPPPGPVITSSRRSLLGGERPVAR